MEAKDLSSLTTHQVHKFFCCLELVEDGDESEKFFQVNNINGEWLQMANSPQYIQDSFPSMRFSEVILSLLTIKKFCAGGVPINRIRKEDVSVFVSTLVNKQLRIAFLLCRLHVVSLFLTGHGIIPRVISTFTWYEISAHLSLSPLMRN